LPATCRKLPDKPGEARENQEESSSHERASGRRRRAEEAQQKVVAGSVRVTAEELEKVDGKQKPEKKRQKKP
jgi:hypothetical protein